MNKVERVFVVSKSGKPLMPTKRLGIVSRVYNQEKPKFVWSWHVYNSVVVWNHWVYGRCNSWCWCWLSNGWRIITTETEELIAGELELRTFMSERLKECVMHRNNWRTRLRIAHHALITGDERTTGAIHSTQVRQSCQASWYPDFDPTYHWNYRRGG